MKDHLLNDLSINNIHIDYYFYYNDKQYFWTHGIQRSRASFISSNSNDIYNDVISKYKYLLNKTLSILEGSDKTLIYIKALKNEYTQDLFIKFYDLIKRPNIFLGIIYENDKEQEINIKLPNTIIIKTNKLTDYYDADADEKYNTQPFYFDLFEKITNYKTN